MKKKLLKTLFLGCLLVIPPVAMAQDGSGPFTPDPVLVTQAEKGDTRAQKNLADQYFRHDDKGNAIKWLRKSADGGFVDAQNLLAFSYKTGNGVPQDIEEGRKWLLKAVEQGSAVAMNNLCISYTDPMAIVGRADAKFPPSPVTGDKEDAGKAFSWCGRAARAGMFESQTKLSWLYAKGSADVKRDFERAYYWMVVSRHHPLKDLVSNELTPEKRAEIEKDARAFKREVPPVKPSATPPKQ